MLDRVSNGEQKQKRKLGDLISSTGPSGEGKSFQTLLKQMSQVRIAIRVTKIDTKTYRDL